MASPEELQRMIRFYVDNLSSSNGHHDFEELCRHLARARIATNVIPATGPVGAAGDQGRDLETFRTFLAQELGRSGPFIARSSDQTIVFICTLRKTRLSKKIKDDVAKIMQGEPGVDFIYAFLGSDLAVGIRHRTQEWVRESFGVALEILDAQWIAQELAQEDTFWIAERYLALPADLSPLPSRDDRLEWYDELLATWRGRDPTETLGDLLSIKRGLRRATFHEPQRSDLPFWLNLVRTFIHDGVDGDLSRRAEYEIAVATLRGTGDLTPVESFVEDFFSGTLRSSREVQLEDASALLMYCIGAFVRAKTTFTRNKLSDWSEALIQRVTLLLSEDPTPNSRAMLLNTLGHLYFQPDALEVIVVGDEIVGAEQLLDDINESDPTFDVSVTPSSLFLKSVDDAMNAWSELLDMLDDAPLFPVERFAEYFDLLTPVLFTHPRYRAVVDSLDRRIESTAGRAAVADRCRRRAITLYETGNYSAAVREFHEAKIGWWSGDTVRGSLLAMMLIARCYEELGYMHAAKQSALLTAYLASTSRDDSLQDLFALGIVFTIHLDYELGAWASAASLSEVGLRLYADLVAPLDPEDPTVSQVMFQLVRIYLSARDLVPALAERVQALMTEAHMWEEMQEFIEHQESREPEQWLTVSDDSLKGEWLFDLKSRITISFRGLGTTWTLTGENNLETAHAMQRLAAGAETLLVDFAGEDLALLKSNITIEVSVGNTRSDRARPLPSNDERIWEVELSPWDSQISDDLTAELVAIIVTILGDSSLLPVDQFLSRLETAMKNGLVHKLGSGPPLDRLLIWSRDNSYDGIQFGTTLPEAIELARFSADEHLQLAWRGGPGPTYERQLAVEAIELRYERIRSDFARTLARLNQNSEFSRNVAQLRREGWLDWQILLAIANIAGNYRMKHLGLFDVRNVESSLLTDATSSVEVPEDEFSIETFKFMLTVTYPLFLRRFGLEIHQDTPDIPSIREFIEERYQYAIDDVAHGDPFLS